MRAFATSLFTASVVAFCAVACVDEASEDERSCPCAKGSACCAEVELCVADGEACPDWCDINQTTCGDGHACGSEQCDDANTAEGDGCSSTCQDEVCADGTIEIGVAHFARTDIAFCASAGDVMPAYADAPALCGVGWHLCTASEFVARNDACGAAPAFSARLDDGSSCRVVHEVTSPFACDSDSVRLNTEGTCTGSTSSTVFSRQTADGTGESVCDWGPSGCGSLCCR